jgi:hypothetical protein
MTLKKCSKSILALLLLLLVLVLAMLQTFQVSAASSALLIDTSSSRHDTQLFNDPTLKRQAQKGFEHYYVKEGLDRDNKDTNFNLVYESGESGANIYVRPKAMTLDEAYCHYIDFLCRRESETQDEAALDKLLKCDEGNGDTFNEFVKFGAEAYMKEEHPDFQGIMRKHA